MPIDREALCREIRAYEITRLVIADPGGQEEIRQTLTLLEAELVEIDAEIGA